MFKATRLRGAFGRWRAAAKTGLAFRMYRICMEAGGALPASCRKTGHRQLSRNACRGSAACPTALRSGARFFGVPPRSRPSARFPVHAAFRFALTTPDIDHSMSTVDHSLSLARDPCAKSCCHGSATGQVWMSPLVEAEKRD
jgi:hypothetical protein